MKFRRNSTKTKIKKMGYIFQTFHMKKEKNYIWQTQPLSGICIVTFFYIDFLLVLLFWYSSGVPIWFSYSWLISETTNEKSENAKSNYFLILSNEIFFQKMLTCGFWIIEYHANSSRTKSLSHFLGSTFLLWHEPLYTTYQSHNHKGPTA